MAVCLLGRSCLLVVLALAALALHAQARGAPAHTRTEGVLKEGIHSPLASATAARGSARHTPAHTRQVAPIRFQNDSRSGSADNSPLTGLGERRLLAAYSSSASAASAQPAVLVLSNATLSPRGGSDSPRAVLTFAGSLSSSLPRNANLTLLMALPASVSVNINGTTSLVVLPGSRGALGSPTEFAGTVVRNDSSFVVLAFPNAVVPFGQSVLELSNVSIALPSDLSNLSANVSVRIEAQNGVAVALTQTSACGDGVVSGSEQCDGAACCSPSCAFVNSTVLCRAAAGPCDVPEYCTGFQGACPPDQLISAASGIVCRVASSGCDLPEYCNGTSSSCPSDQFRANGTRCLRTQDAGIRTGLCDGDGACDTAPIGCGDGIRDAGEQCDGGPCCSSNCTFLNTSVVCRAAAGGCDVAETCTGASAECPPNSFVVAGTVCRAAAGACDVAEECSGSGASCPNDAFRPSGFVCRGSSGVCDVAENCTGSSALCPDNAFRPAGTVCRAAAGACDVAENCTGSSAECPANLLQASGTLCRAAAGECDDAEFCTGSSAACPPNQLVAAGTLCRTAAGECDIAENCTGSSPLCPVQAYRPVNTSCGDALKGRCSASGQCEGDGPVCGDGIRDAGEQCDGGPCCSSNCTFLNTSVVCRAAAGGCDVAETCTGASAECPPNSFVVAGTVCRAAAGACDVAEECSGSGPSCPNDAFRPSGFVCRGSSGVCDVAENCTGSSALCPDNAFRPAGTVCRAAAGACDVAEDCTGSSAECPGDAFLPNTTLCRVAAGECDVSEHCSGSAPLCPTNLFKPPTVLCRARNTALPCDGAEFCTGNTSTCPPDLPLGPATLCRAPTGVCDRPEYCNGTSYECPPNEFYGSDHPCNKTDACGFPLRCSGTDATTCATCALGSEFRRDRCELCSVGSYGSVAGQCSPCPRGALCDSQGTTLSTMGTEEGFWRKTGESLAFFKCEREDSCVGGQGNQTCEDGYTGVLCALCDIDERYFPFGGRCIKCPSRGTSVAVIIIVFILLALIFFLFFRSFGATDDARERSRLGFLKILIGFLQVLSASTALSTPWPSVYSDVAATLSFSQLNFFQFIPFDCLAESRVGFYTQFVAALVIPCVLAAILYAQLRVSTSKHRLRSHEREISRFWKNAAFIGLVVYPIIALRVFQTFSCRDVDGVSYLRADFTIRCDDASHSGFVFMSAVCLVFVVLGVPVLFAAYLYRNRAQLESPKVLLRVGFLVNDYRPRYAWWELVRIIHKTAYWFIAAVIAEEGASQILGGYIVSSVALLLHLAARPYQERVENILEFSALTAESLTLFVGLLLKAGVVSPTNVAASVFVLFTNALVVLLALYAIFFTGDVVGGAKGAWRTWWSRLRRYLRSRRQERAAAQPTQRAPSEAPGFSSSVSSAALFPMPTRDGSQAGPSHSEQGGGAFELSPLTGASNLSANTDLTPPSSGRASPLPVGGPLSGQHAPTQIAGMQLPSLDIPSALPELTGSLNVRGGLASQSGSVPRIE